MTHDPINQLKTDIMANSNCREDRAELLAKRYYYFSGRSKHSELWKTNIRPVLTEIKEVTDADSIEDLATLKGIKPEDCLAKL